MTASTLVRVLPVLLALGGCASAQQPARSSPGLAASAIASASPTQSTREERCRDAGRACGAAILSASDDRGLDCMADEAIAYFGGRATVAAALATVKADMAEKNVTIEGGEFDLPHEMVASGGKLFAILPQRVMIKLPQGHVRTHSYLLAVSSDDGQTWKFVDGARLTLEKVRSIFPSFPLNLALPEVGPLERLP
jgi:hypothetical protein